MSSSIFDAKRMSMFKAGELPRFTAESFGAGAVRGAERGVGKVAAERTFPKEEEIEQRKFTPGTMNVPQASVSRDASPLKQPPIKFTKVRDYLAAEGYTPPKGVAPIVEGTLPYAEKRYIKPRPEGQASIGVVKSSPWGELIDINKSISEFLTQAKDVLGG